MKKVLLLSFLAILGIVVLVVAVYMASRLKRYSKIFNTNHYYEIYRKIGEIKEAAIKNIESEESDALWNKADPRALFTEAGLAIFYTISKTDNKYEHHVSISQYGRYTPHAVGEHFILYVADIMSWKIQKAIFFFTELPVYHGVIELSAEEHLAWEKKPIVKYRFDRKDDLRKRIWGHREQVRFDFVALHDKDD
ncbi:MAG: hypothetical protein ACFFAJ_16040 [Candidatus Hodarchaeota archaeon]